MARKSNKTAHVLNLIAGHDAGKDDADSANTPNSGTASAKAEQTAAQQPAQAAPAASAAPQNIAVIDTTEEDPVADLIQQKLSNEFEQQANPQDAQAPETGAVSVGEPSSDTVPTHGNVPDDAPSPVSASEPEPEAVTVSNTEPDDAPSPVSASEPEPEAVTVSETKPDDAPSPVSASEPEPEAVTVSETKPDDASSPVSASEPEPEAVTVSETKPDDASSPVSASEPEPDFVRLNVMEGIVKDKIIYFMRQFDVCTCGRCVNDTIALTMNGLLPKYIVTTPAAVDPLMSYYTNRLISDVTVEATKACMIVKDNPRH